ACLYDARTVLARGRAMRDRARRAARVAAAVVRIAEPHAVAVAHPLALGARGRTAGVVVRAGVAVDARITAMRLRLVVVGGTDVVGRRWVPSHAGLVVEDRVARHDGDAGEESARRRRLEERA